MKIAITSTGETLESDMDPHFGRALYYLILDTENGGIVEAINNNENVNASGGAGTSATQVMAHHEVRVVISGNYGPNASRGLHAFNIKMMQSPVKKIKEVLADYQSGNLKEVMDATVEGHH
jgi:predicted Fe-Mo cluster-binding NifX family protein